jgi:putative hydrolase of the HAD superfamily
MVIFFDIDDTLIDDSGATKAAAEVLRKRFRPEIGCREFIAAWESSIDVHCPRFLAGDLSFQGQRRERVRDCIDRSIDDVRADEIFGAYLEAYEASWEVFPDVRPGLKTLGGYDLGVISNGQSDQQRKKLSRTGLMDSYSWVVTADDCGHAKPSREIFEFACSEAAVATGHAVYVGDQFDTDARAAINAGLRGIWLDRRAEAPKDCSVPVISSLQELAPFLEVL